jgi:hypothetical protein
MFSILQDELRENNDVLSPSSLITLHKSPKHFYYKHILKIKEEPTDAMLEGTMFHHAVLEPESFFDKYVVLDSKDNYLSTIDDVKSRIVELGAKPVKGKKEDLEKQLLELDPNAKLYSNYINDLAKSNKVFVNEDQYTRAKSIIEEISNNPWLSRALKLGQKELKCYFHHELDVILNMRMDYFEPEFGSKKLPLIMDLKLVRSADQKYFERAIWEQGLHIQAAVNVDAIKSRTGKDAMFAWICVEPKPPHCIEIYCADFGLLEAGRDTYYRLIHKYKECKQTNNWPSYNAGKLTSCSLPHWAFSQLNFED